MVVKEDDVESREGKFESEEDSSNGQEMTTKTYKIWSPIVWICIIGL